MGVCETCGYGAECAYFALGRDRCQVVVILECRELAKTDAFRSLIRSMPDLYDKIVENRTARDLFELLTKIQYNAGLETPGWEDKISKKG